MGTLRRGLTLQTPGQTPSSKMGKFDGKFVMESHQNIGPAMLALGMTEDMLKRMLDPQNKMTITMVENSDGSFTSTTTHSLATEFNTCHTFKIGETTTIKEPWPCTMTVTKKSDSIWANRTEMGGKVMNTETTGHNYGFSLRGTIEGTALSFSEEFKKVDPQVTGFALRNALLATRRPTLSNLTKNMNTLSLNGM